MRIYFLEVAGANMGISELMNIKMFIVVFLLQRLRFHLL